MKGAVLVALLAAALPSWLHLPAAVERWLYNPRERTRTAQERLDDGNLDAAVGALETARRLAPEDPQVLYNQGTGHLLADRRDAPRLLEEARDRLPALPANQRDPGLAADVWYNLGTAYLQAGDGAQAVPALEEALRQRPGDAAARHNLELALARREQQRAGRRDAETAPPRQTEGGRPETDPEGTDADGAEGPSDPEPAASSSGAPGEGENENAEAPAAGDRLRRFEEQADMSAEQAAALLAAVEDLERAQRREAAGERTRRQHTTEEDW